MNEEARKTKSLNGIWKATDTIATDLGFVRSDFDDSEWLDIEVPGHWQTTPGFENYPEKVIYRCRFDAADMEEKHRLFVRFNGVFYFCRVWCNGMYLGEHTGYFNPFEFEITDVVKEQGNVLTVFARCEVEKDVNDKRQVLGVFADWDCKPNDVQPGGIWNSVELVEKGLLSLEQVKIGDYELADSDATAVVRAEIQGVPKLIAGNMKVTWKIAPDNFDGEVINGELLHSGRDVTDTELAFEVSIPEVKLWWPWDHGPQNLYRFELQLYSGDVLMDAVSVRFGVRTVEMKDFIMYVNGRRIFCRGSNYAPGNIRIAAMTRELYEKDFDLIVGANLNMIRVHAHIEKPEFYDLCDERGIMVWQDFPLQWYYAREVEESAVAQIGEMVSLLMSHPGVAVWCCHNEPFKNPGDVTFPEAITENRLQDIISSLATITGGNWNKDVLDRKLEKAVGELDGGRPVVPHSGILGLMKAGTDGHFYFGWYFGTMRMLKSMAGLHKKSFRFVTEYGAQAYPILENFRKLQNVSEVSDIDWDEMEAKYKLQKRIMDKFVPVQKGGSLSSYIEVSQWYQARIVKYYNEFLRGMKYSPCGGAVHFLFNDCCPAVTCAVLDAWRDPKKGYAALRDSFRPLHIMAEFPKRWYPCGETVSLKVTVVNDKYEDYPGARVRWAFFNDTGTCFSEGIKVLDIPEDSCVKAGRAKWGSADAAPGGYALVLELFIPGSEEPIVNQYEFELRKRKRR